MGRGKRNLIDVLAGLPWPVGLVVGALGYLTLAHGLPKWFARQGGPFAQVFAGEPSPLPLLTWVFLVLCAIGALASFLQIPAHPPAAGHTYRSGKHRRVGLARLRAAGRRSLSPSRLQRRGNRPGLRRRRHRSDSASRRPTHPGAMQAMATPARAGQCGAGDVWADGPWLMQGIG